MFYIYKKNPLLYRLEPKLFYKQPAPLTNTFNELWIFNILIPFQPLSLPQNESLVRTAQFNSPKLIYYNLFNSLNLDIPNFFNNQKLNKKNLSIWNYLINRISRNGLKIKLSTLFTKNLFLLKYVLKELKSSLLLIWSKYIKVLKPLFYYKYEKVDKRFKKAARLRKKPYWVSWSYLPASKRQYWILNKLITSFIWLTGRTLNFRIFEFIKILYNPLTIQTIKKHIYKNNFYVFYNLRTSVFFNNEIVKSLKNLK